jgi:hypothetical protein
VPNTAPYHPACNPRFSPRGDKVLVHSHDPAILQIIRDFLEPLGFKVEVASSPDPRSLDSR